MKKVCMAVIALAAIAILAGPAMAQPGRQQSPISLLTHKETAADMKLSDDQVKKFKELQDKQPRGGMGMGGGEEMRKWNEEVTKAIDGLKDDQKKRLEQLRFQQRGIRNFYNTGFGGPGGGGGGGGLNKESLYDLGVASKDDKKKLEEVGKAYAKAREELGTDFMSEEYRKKSAELSKTYVDKFVACLSGEAKKTYEELCGPTYKGEWPQPTRPGTGA